MTARAIRIAAAGLAAAVPAILLWAAFPPRNETIAIVFALAPALALARTLPPKRSAIFFFAFGFVYWMLSLSWMPAIVKNNGPWPLVMLGWFALSALCAGYFALYGYAAAAMWRFRNAHPSIPAAAAIFGEAAIWCATEWLRAVLFTGFPWNFLGTSLAGAPFFAAPARIGGVYLVSALLVLLNGTFATLLLRVFRPVSAPCAETPSGSAFRRVVSRTSETVLPLAAILACLAAGNRAVRSGRDGDTAPARLRVALIQRNAPCCFKPGMREDPMEAFGSLADAVAAAKPDLVVLAESAMSEFGNVRSQPAIRAARALLFRSGAKFLIAGGDDVAGDGRVYNAAALYSAGDGADAGPAAVYRKQHLVPFGEYIPLDKWITPLQKLSPVGVSLHPGEPAVFDIKTAGGDTVRIAPLICFEDTDPRISARARRMGADAIVLITNDSWFSMSAEAECHAAQAVLRAIETGLPVIRTGNSGVTGTIRADGSASWLRDTAGKPIVDARGVMVDTVEIAVAGPQPQKSGD